ncbi:ATP-binding protein [Skermanella pratensis]|uniref:ATP-binding protein n=1 Tax=Skermanella pratensis TaxID=2233999 RepID=UPI001787AC37|nr:AAA family ATPase [Skermanella pratensis]
MTALFCDIVGSTALSEQLDPEDMCNVIRAYRDVSTGVVERFDGWIARHLGDGILIYFGYPAVQENDAERAVRTGLALVRAVAGLVLPSRPGLRVRVGIATGLVVVDDLADRSVLEERMVIGGPLNLAARLQTLAEPNSVVIAETTRRLIGGLFDCTDMGDQELRGFAKPVRVWRVDGERNVASRFAALHDTGSTPMIGREEEFALLADRWHRSAAGDGQVVLLGGEPGIGKSRMLHELSRHLGIPPDGRLDFSCSPQFRHTAFFPVIEALEREAGLAADDRPERRIDKLRAMLARSGCLVDEVLQPIASLLSIPFDDRGRPVIQDSGQRRELMLDALAAHFGGLASRRPMLLQVEDAHAADPSTLELLTLIMNRARSLRLMLIVTFRLDFNPPWTADDRSHCTSIVLKRFTPEQSAMLVTSVAQRGALPDRVIGRIIGRADGVPLFIEELTRAVLESSVPENGWGGPSDLPATTIPATLHDLLMARLDRLAPGKEVAQIGAVIGREFSHDLLAAVSDLDDRALSDALDQLTGGGLLLSHGTPPKATYSFKHALIQETAYQALLRGKRRQLHGRIVRTLVGRFPDTVRNRPELVARHYEEAGQFLEAAQHRLIAGQRALAQSGSLEAVEQVNEGLRLLARLPEGIGRDRLEIPLQITLGAALAATKGLAAPEVGGAYVRARQLCEQIGERTQLLTALYGQTEFHLGRAELRHALAIAKELLAEAEQQRETSARLTGHTAVGVISFYLGQLEAAGGHLEQAIALHDLPQSRNLPLVQPYNHRIKCLGFLSWNLFSRGYPDKAVERQKEALTRARLLSHPATLAFALEQASDFSAYAGAPEQVADLTGELIGLASDCGFASALAAGRILRGWALVHLGRTAEGMPIMQEGMAAYRATRGELGIPFHLALFAEALSKAGRASEGLVLIDEAIERAERWELGSQAELQWRRGELLIAVDQGAAAEAALRRGLDIARGQNARMRELRAATSLARLWQRRGRRREARELLEPIYSWFGEGLDTRDLKNARAVLSWT